MIHSFLKNLLLLSLSGGFAALVLILLSFITKKVFSPKWHFFSYKVILLLFIIPSLKFINSEFFDSISTLSSFCIFSAEQLHKTKIVVIKSSEKTIVRPFNFNIIYLTPQFFKNLPSMYLHIYNNL